MPTSKVLAAAVQATPVFLDRDATVEKAARLTKEAAASGAGLVVFPEAFVPGYPDWVWRTTPWSDRAWYERLYDQSLDVPGPATEALGSAAQESSTYLSIGVNERDLGTLYNTLLYFGPDGSLLGKHRKLMATGAERLVWGQGDGSGLLVFDTPFGRLGGLTCWENYMPLARAALYAQGVDVYLAPTWDNSDMWVPTLRHIAKEGRVYVIGVTSCLRGSDVPRGLPGAEEIYGGDDDWMARGNTTICGPDGEIVAGPLVETEGIVYAEIDTDHARKVRRQFDPVGHYSRSEILRLVVDREAKSVYAGGTPGGREGYSVVKPHSVLSSPRQKA
ncbi:carbon-nitrogen hydrolase family protein [soil metagenome]